jgi:flagellar protein FliS
MSNQPGAIRYLDARITSASQAELQLLLLDGALRFGRQAQQLWDSAEPQERDRLLSRTFDIVEELVRSVAVGKGELSKRLEEEYAFAGRQLALAQVNGDVLALDAALKLLAFHRDTWIQACNRLKADLPPTTPAGPHNAMLGAQSLSLQA